MHISCSVIKVYSFIKFFLNTFFKLILILANCFTCKLHLILLHIYKILCSMHLNFHTFQPMAGPCMPLVIENPEPSGYEATMLNTVPLCIFYSLIVLSYLNALLCFVTSRTPCRYNACHYDILYNCLLSKNILNKKVCVKENSIFGSSSVREQAVGGCVGGE